VGVVYHDGSTGRFIAAPLPGEDFSTKDGFEVLEMDLDDWERFIQQTDHVNVLASVRDEHGNVAKALVRKSERQVDSGIKWSVHRRDHFRCRYCGEDKLPLTVDHLVLWEEGGPTTDANLVSCCKKCNRTRGNTPYHAWLKSAFYKKVSQRIPPMIQEQNERLAGTLAAIPIHPLKGNRKR